MDGQNFKNDQETRDDQETLNNQEPRNNQDFANNRYFQNDQNYLNNQYSQNNQYSSYQNDPFGQEPQNPYYVESTTPENRYQDYTSNNQYRNQQSEKSENNAPAIASLILGILSVITCCLGSGFFMGIGGIICGVSANNKQGKSGMSIAGIILSVMGIILGILYYIFYILITLSSL